MKVYTNIVCVRTLRFGWFAIDEEQYYDLSKVETEIRGNEKPTRALEKVLWPFVFQYVTVYFDALGHSRHRHHRFVFKHIFVFYRNSIFWNTIAFYTILNIIILSLHDVDRSEKMMTKVLEAVDFIFDSEGNEKWIGLFLQKNIVNFIIIILRPLFRDWTKNVRSNLSTNWKFTTDRTLKRLFLEFSSSFLEN